MVFYPFHISVITIDFRKFKTDIVSTEVWIGKFHTGMPKDKYKSRKGLRQTFDPPMVLSHGDTFSLRIKYFDKADFWQSKTKHIHFDPDDIVHIYNASKKGLDTTAKISRQTPCLVSGKSSLINHVFGVETVITSHVNTGEADINHEFISPQNNRLVIHNSKGFEPGEEVNLKTVRDFINCRRNMSALEKQLHVIWLCIEIPPTGRRLLETGIEEFLEWKCNGTLGNNIKEHVTRIAEVELQNSCIGPLEKFVESDTTNATVSSAYQHSDRFIHASELGMATVMTSIIQRMDLELRIKASIEVGKKRWNALTGWKVFISSFKTDELHNDIINAWKLNDPHHTLYLVSESQELTCKAIKLVVNSYHLSPISGEVLTQIQEYDRQLTILECMDPDSLDKIIEMMQYYSIDAEEVFKLREVLPPVDLLSDGKW
ncbi:uncharacterized protein EDB93DRAFT_1106118 [Suillus bovinus]|uniref:uncharacterized protein n=1 Tax=Suillus bovinus TaxID=48563 RepID=UPI001B861616|nr:uncharacterized protein EDB93DRAFT_1106118 [Suillus bovinus]KAG2139636.1 hypothetical protein EDB93DRAFT_1106118 [Suillus bovinus]